MIGKNKFQGIHYLFLVITVTILISCKHKKADLSGDAPIKVNDFMAVFPPIVLPYAVTDTNIGAFADTITIGHAVISQFVPDSVLEQLVNTKKKFAVHPVGRFEKENEIYLLLNVVQKEVTQQVVAVFDMQYKYLSAKAILSNEQDEDGYTHTLSINKEPTFTVSKERINAQTKQVQFSRVGWVYNTAGVFMVVVNDTNEDPKKIGVILNPIDTLPRKNKLSGEYVTNKQNFISIRDGKDANSYLFFIHFEKKEGTCTGELKGVMKMANENTGIYSEAGDPCIIDFNFDEGNITLKEQGSCGNRRGMECYFNDTFTKKKKSRI